MIQREGSGGAGYCGWASSNSSSDQVGATFRTFPSYPQRYTDVITPQPASPEGVRCRVDPLKTNRVATCFADEDLILREFGARSSRRLGRPARKRAA